MSCLKSASTVLAVTCLLLFGGASAAMAQCQFARRTAAPPTEDLLIGTAIAVTEDRVFVAAPHDFGFSNDYVYVYSRLGGGFVLEDTFTSDNFPTSFAHDVAAAGDWLAVRATNQLLMFRELAGEWEEILELEPLGPVDDSFGHSISMDGDRIAVTAPGMFSSSLDTAFVFERVGAFTWVEQVRIEAPPGVDGFGQLIALHGDRVVVSCACGSLFIYEFDGVDWNLVDEIAFGSAGSAVYDLDLDGDTIAFTHRPNGSDDRFVNVFEHDGSDWTLDQQFVGSHDEEFGQSLDLDGDELWVGVPRHSQDLIGHFWTGEVRRYTRLAGTFVANGAIAAPGRVAETEFGRSVIAVDGELYVGAPEEPSVGARSGAVYAIDTTRPSCSPYLLAPCGDCDADGVLDACAIEAGAADCNGNGIPDSCDLVGGTSLDVDGNGIPDECETDCDGDGLADLVEIAGNPALDCDADGVLDACQSARPVLLVPAEYATIQAAIEAAPECARVVISPGIYPEAIDLLGKSITVESAVLGEEVLLGGDGVGPTISCVNGEGPTAVLRGLTCFGGPFAMDIQFASPTVERCIVASTIEGVYTVHSSARFIDCAFTANEKALQIAVSQLTVDGCDFTGNGPFSAVITGISPGPTVFRGCRFIANHSASHGGAVEATGPSELRFENCRFESNFTEYHSGRGGALYLGYRPTVIDGCIFRDNSAELGGVIEGGHLELRRSVFAENSAGAGGAIWNPRSLGIDYCTIVDNAADESASIDASNASVVTIRNSIARGATSGDIDVPLGSLIQYCAIRPGTSTQGPTVWVDPLLFDPANGDYRLTTASPCRDAADPADPFDADGTVADIGAFPFETAKFIRGDTNADGSINIGDAVHALSVLFLSERPKCELALDANHSDSIDIADALTILNYMFAMAGDLDPPFPDCGPDDTFGPEFCPDSNCP